MAVMAGKVALMEALRAEGVEYVFGNPGTSEGPILDALEGYPDIRYVLVTQEGAAMGMADAYARYRGKPAFVNLHIETGLANGVSLLANAAEGGTPLVLTSANKDVRKLAEGRTDLVEMVRQFCKWSAEVTHPEQVAGVMRRAFNEARTPPTGPVYVGFSANALDDEGEVEIVAPAEGYYRIAPDERAVGEAARLLAGAEMPALVVGDRVAASGGMAEAVRLAETVGARVFAAQFSQVNFPTSHPQFLGLVSPSMPDGRAALADADVVVAVGTSVFPTYFHFGGRALGSGTALVHIDSALGEIGRSEPTAVGMHADPKVGLARLEEAVGAVMTGSEREAAKGRVAAVAEVKAAQRVAWEERVGERWDGAPMSAERMMAEVAGALPADAIVVDDAVTTRGALFGALDFDEAGSLLGISGGALGWGMGGALGVKLAAPERPVVAVVGDGSSMMTVQALWTAANAGIAVVYVICNNAAYRVLKLNMNLYQTQILGKAAAESEYIGMDFPTPLNIAGMAEAMGVYGRRIVDAGEVGPALREAVGMGRAVVLDVAIDGGV